MFYQVFHTSGKPFIVGEGFRDSFLDLKSCIKSYQLLVPSLFPLLLIFCYWTVTFVSCNMTYIGPLKLRISSLQETVIMCNFVQFSMGWNLSPIEAKWVLPSMLVEAGHSLFFLKHCETYKVLLDIGKKIVVMMMTNSRFVKNLS